MGSGSEDDRSGCQWSAVSDTFEDGAVVDLVTEPGLPSRLYAIQSTMGDGGLVARVLESNDGGAHWSSVGALVEGISPFTIDVARARPERLYLGGPDGAIQNGVVAVSDDRGASWALRRFPSPYVYVSGIDPIEPNPVLPRPYR